MGAILAQKLTKIYDGKRMAVNELTLEIPEGTIYGFLGPTGAGKTTAVKLLSGLLKPTEGSCAVMGLDPARSPDKVHRICGVLTDTAQPYRQMTGMENLLFFGQAAGMKPDDCKTRASELLRELEIFPLREQRVNTYSTGDMQRLSLARALMHRPKVLFLDEPTSGLDSEAAKAAMQLIYSIAAREAITVFLCTHRLRYAEDLCTSFGVVSHGSLIADGDLKTLCQKAGCKAKASIRLPAEDQIEGYVKRGEFWEKDLKGEEEMPELLRELVSAGHDVYEARMLRPSLEDVCVSFLGKEGV